jgi:L-ascorbate metabolism protein UlaG (beta-lactamase superfamily)
MKVGFLGHNGFALGSQSAPILVDAILFPKYGQEYTSSPVEIYPPRLIDLEAMPVPAAVVVSHEHSDHFHLPSLNLVPRSPRSLGS